MGTEAKKYRAYFNSAADGPFFWSIDSGAAQTEVKVKAVVIDGATAASRVSLTRDNLSAPRAWLEIEGTLQLAGDMAIFRA